MKFLTRIGIIVSLLLTLPTFAESKKSFRFENQKEEVFDLENFLKETRYKTETVQTTCYRQEPYVENVCRDVTRYRQECETVPGRQECRTVYDQVCRTENRYENECRYERGEPICRVVVNYRRECTQGSGGRQCRTIPGDVVCHRAPNGEQKCEKIPPREVCEDVPGREECRNVPYEERECSEGPSRQVCEQVNRPYQVCDNVSRQQCDWIPAHQQCSQIPYSVNECKDETLYRQIPYDCIKDIQVPYEVVLKTHRANVKVLFNDLMVDSSPSYTVALDEKGAVQISGKVSNDNDLVSFATKEVKANSQGDINTINATVKVTHMKVGDMFNVERLSNIELGKKSLKFVVEGAFDPKRVTLGVNISKKGEVKFEKVLTPKQFKVVTSGSQSTVTVDLKSLGAPNLGGIFNRKHYVSLRLKLDLGVAGDVVIPLKRDMIVDHAEEVEVN
jgi:hypothetical protein